MSLAEALAPAIEALEDQREDIDRALAMLRNLVAGEGQQRLPNPSPPPARPAPIVTAPPPKAKTDRPKTKPDAGRPRGHLSSALLEALDSLNRWCTVAELVEATEAEKKAVYNALMFLASDKCAGGKPRIAQRAAAAGGFEYGPLSLLPLRAAAAVRAASNGREARS